MKLKIKAIIDELPKDGDGGQQAMGKTKELKKRLKKSDAEPKGNLFH